MVCNFEILGIKNQFVEILAKNGITEPTPVQEKAIPELVAGRDIIAQAQTGTGKTLAFLLPVIQKTDPVLSHVQALIITPTRELALQITAEVRKLIKDTGIKVLAAYGGQDVEAQIKKLRGSMHIVIGTPGRLLDHLRRGTVDLGKISMLVLDEADQMLDMGFSKDVELIVKQCSRTHQTMLFSATISKAVRVMAAKYLRHPAQVQIQRKNITLDEIDQLVVQTTERGKKEALLKLLEDENPFMAIIFCRTKRRSNSLNMVLQLLGYKSDELHGDITQAKREKVMKAFRKADLQLLVATDVAARGLDIEGVTHIFNYDVPEDAESYIHRIGRTGRAGQTGRAITLATPRDRESLMEIEKGIKTRIERRRLTDDQLIEKRKEAVKLPSHENSLTKSFGKRKQEHRKSSSNGRSPSGFIPKKASTVTPAGIKASKGKNLSRKSRRQRKHLSVK